MPCACLPLCWPDNSSIVCCWCVQTGGHKLVKVALVYDEHRLHFSLATCADKTSNTQLLPGDTAVLHSTATETVYQVHLVFTGGLFGHFTQMIVFDFGQRPLVARKVVAELGDLKMQERVQVLRDKLTFNRWECRPQNVDHWRQFCWLNWYKHKLRLNRKGNWYWHTHTHLFNGPFLGLPRWAGTREVKPIWILLKQETVSGSDMSWAICKSAPCSRQITTPAPHYSVFTGRMPLLPPSQQRQSIEGTELILNKGKIET